MAFQRPPKLISLYIKSCVIGFLVSAIFVAGLILFDVAGLKRLLTGSDVAVLAVLIMWVFNGIVFAGVQFGVAIMGMAEPNDDDDDHQGGQMIPVPVRSDARRR